MTNIQAELDPAPPKTAAIHFKRLDAVRGLAAQPVVLSHAFGMVLPDGIGAVTDLIGWSARLSVIVFFVLSGFVISLGLVRELTQRGSFDWFDFGIRRLGRIYPPYLVTVVLTALLAVLASNELLHSADGHLLPSGVVSAFAFLRTSVFLFTSLDSITIMAGPVWSLRLEVVLYAVSALVALAVVSNGPRRPLFAAATFLLAILFFWRLSYSVTATVVYGCGAFAAIFFARVRKLPLAWSSFGLGLAFAVPLILPEMTNDTISSLVYQSFLGVPIAAVIVGLAATHADRVLPLEAFAIRTGDWSYSLYILHWPLLVICYAILQHLDLVPGQLALKIALAAALFVIINVVAWLIARVIERPRYFAGVLRKFAAGLRPTSPRRGAPPV